MTDAKKPQQEHLNCFEKLEQLNDKLKQLARLMNTMREGMEQQRRRQGH